MENTNVVLDFTQNKSQPLALMSAPLAKRLLQYMVDHMQSSTSEEIFAKFMSQLCEIDPLSNECLTKAIETATAFVEERHLVANITNENWDAYKVQSVEPKKNY